jgi:hypothetical protein
MADIPCEVSGYFTPAVEAIISLKSIDSSPLRTGAVFDCTEELIIAADYYRQ